VRERELEVLGEELLDVGTTDVRSLLDLGDLQDLWGFIRICVYGSDDVGAGKLTWMDLKRARWRAAMSW
jgi:hypothetical protein